MNSELHTGAAIALTFARKFMDIDISNLVSGIVGGVIALLGAFLIAYFQYRWAVKENEKQRVHDLRMNDKREKHDKDMQRREQNIRSSGIADRREIGGG